MFCLGHGLRVALIRSIIEVEDNRQILTPCGEIFEQCYNTGTIDVGVIRDRNDLICRGIQLSGSL